MMNPATHSSAPGRIRVMIVDDSAVVRGLIHRWLEAEAGIEIAGVSINGADALRQVSQVKPDVMILDVEMPQLDGISALPKILSAAPGVQVIMASTLTQRNAKITIEALSLGAADYLPKPETGRLAGADVFKRDLIAKVRALGQRALRLRSPQTTMGAPAASTMHRPAVAPAPRTYTPATPLKPATALDALVIGSSTGGPQALREVISAIGGKVQVPILIAQHMPATFTSILAEHLSKLSSSPAVEAKDGMPIKPGHIYVAPGDFHMTVKKPHGAIVIGLDKNPPVNFCRPAVDPLFMSAAEIWGPKLLGVILTGMGHDGRDGCANLVAKGARTLVQDEASSVVWGMPGAVYNAGHAQFVKPLADIGPSILALLQGRNP
jgi:two-component system, chemotaxis family, protein-glutamate methylesterase/glutaminase